MQKIVIRHLTGMKANQVEDIPLQGFREVLIGRDPGAHIHFDADREDLVSRNHARIVQDPADPNSFLLADLQSRNGTFINKQRVYGTQRVQHGDRIQLGPAGPEFTFEIDPPPAARPTRLAEAVQPAPATRESAAPGGLMGGPSMPPGMTSPVGSDQPRPVGRATVERMLDSVTSRMKGESRRTLWVALAGILVLLLVGAGYFVYDYTRKAAERARLDAVTAQLADFQKSQDVANQRLLEAQTTLAKARATGNSAAINKALADLAEKTREAQEAKQALQTERDKAAQLDKQGPGDNTAVVPPVAAEPGDKTPVQIAEDNKDSVVLVRVGWKLNDPSTGRQLYVYHHHFSRGACGHPEEDYLPMFIQNNGVIRPVLSTLDNDGKNQVITGEARGTGFIVSSSGFLLTNRHVLAPWRQPYERAFSRQDVGVMMLENGGLTCLQATQFPTDWAPIDGSLVVDKLDASIDAKGKVNKTLSADVAAYHMAYPRIEGQGGKNVEGGYTYLDVVFARTKQEYKAEAVTISDRHDVAVARVNVPSGAKPVTLFNGDSATIKPGQPMVVMGYPIVSPEQVASDTSRDMIQNRRTLSVIADPTTTGGLVAKVILDASNIRGVDGVISSGAVYELGINTTGAGNSGGPVFDTKGRVVGIFYASGSEGRATVTFAVPISYGNDLIKNQPII